MEMPNILSLDLNPSITSSALHMATIFEPKVLDSTVFILFLNQVIWNFVINQQGSHLASSGHSTTS